MIAIALVLGESVAWWNPVAAWIIGILLSMGSCFFGMNKKYRAGRTTLKWSLPVFFLLGVCLWSRANRETDMEFFLQQGKESRGALQGIVSSVQIGENGKKQIIIKSSIFCTKEGKRIQGRGILIHMDNASVPLKIGNKIQVEGTLSAFDTASNPGQFDMGAYQKARGIEGMMWGDTAQILDHDVYKMRQLIWEIREILKEKIKELSGEEDAGIFNAVFMGDKTGLDEKIKKLYEESGIAHIYAVSGTHISILGALFYQFSRKLTGSYGISAGVGGVILLLYALLVGTPISAVRATLMFLCYMIANVKGRIYDLTSALALSSIVLLLWQPLQITQGSFQLSFAAVLGIGILGPSILPRWKKHSKLARTFSMALGVQFMIMPIQLYHFFTYPVYSVFLNLCILPVIPLLIISILLGTCAGFLSPLLGKFILGTGHWILIYNKFLCEFFLKIPMSVIITGRPRTIQLICYYMVLFCFIIQRELMWQRKKKDVEWKREAKTVGQDGEGIKVCLVGLICFLMGIAGLKRISLEVFKGQMSITMLDVGQGDGFVVRLPDGSVIIIDGGSTSKDQIGTYCLEPYLKYEGIDRIDYVLLSHGDADHTNGIQEIMEQGNISIGTCIIPDVKNVEKNFSMILSLSKEKDIVIQYLSTGMQLLNGDVRLTCLHPKAGMQTEDINDTSEVILLEMKEFRMLFTGDVGEKVEGFSSVLSDLPIAVLKVAHHGSKYSTGEKFMENINARYAWISYGENNRYGHPHKETMERLQKLGCEIYTTVEYGAVKLMTDGNNMEIMVFKSRQ